jgi:aminocarboxymuconate-semialdehyde decarboxylase
MIFGKDRPYEPILIKNPPSYYLKKMYFDSACYYAPAARMCVESVGVDHVLLGTDAPPLNAIKRKGIAVLDEIGLSEVEKSKIMGQNAKTLLKV